MYRFATWIALPMLTTACACPAHNAVKPSMLTKELIEYAQAACLARQPQAFIAEQGRAWANVIVQSSTLDVEEFARVSDAVKAALAQSVTPVTHLDAPVGQDIRLYLMHCHEISRLPAIGAAAAPEGAAGDIAPQP